MLVAVSVTVTAASERIAARAGCTAPKGRNQTIAATQATASTTSTTRPASRHPPRTARGRRARQRASRATTTVRPRSTGYAGWPCTTGAHAVSSTHPTATRARAATARTTHDHRLVVVLACSLTRSPVDVGEPRGAPTAAAGGPPTFDTGIRSVRRRRDGHSGARDATESVVPATCGCG